MERYCKIVHIFGIFISGIYFAAVAAILGDIASFDILNCVAEIFEKPFTSKVMILIK